MVLALESVLRNGRIVCHNYCTVVNKELRALMSRLVTGDSVHFVSFSDMKKRKNLRKNRFSIS